jgi:hypothetical protein
MIRNLVIFYGEELLAPRPTPKLEDHRLSAVRDCLFNVFAATLHICRPFLHPQPKDAPCRGDRDPLIMGPSCNAEIKNGWSYTSTVPVMAYKGTTLPLLPHTRCVQ